ncbi:hypothetical protein MA16_Dca005064 [Dendrobium catenatum]|uniref:Uncharacterized protein n=1 Tax=Dendrobium catenatum TaxID=906689 RepID=A0A2I0WGT7_9ASPA|nr:hypothetical protein MA16_Dca005064 [Dendrobium catenatum]
MSNKWCTIEGFNIGRPFNHSLFAPDLTPIYMLCHSRKTINRALILHKGDSSEKREKRSREGGESAPPRPPSEFFPPSEYAGILPDFWETSEFCKTL